MGNTYRDIPSLMHHKERELFLECLRHAPDGDCVDLGVYRGSSAAMMCDVRGTSSGVWILDNGCRAVRTSDKSGIDDALRRLKALGYTPKALRQNSFDPPPDGIRVAALSIDTDHVGEVVAKEMDCWRPTLVPGAIVLLHDCNKKEFPCLVAEVDRRFTEPEWEFLGQAVSLRAYRLRGEVA